jgi:pimeloyl-ACP methyl ester carboxylesterase
MRLFVTTQNIRMAIAWILIASPAVFAQEIVTLSTRPGVTQAFFIASLPQNPHAVAVLFPGSGGLIRLRQENGQIKFGQNNFLVRSRGEFVQRGVVTTIIDAASDHQTGWGMSDEFRLGKDHFTDVSAVVADLGKRFPGLPLFLVGTSRGSTSAAALGTRFGPEVSGVVLTSTMLRPAGAKSKEPGPGLSGFDFSTIKGLVLFVHHVSDQCGSTPYGDAARLADKYPLISVFGGRAPESGPCDPFSAHGYFGKESETVEEIVNWMLKKPFREEVR